MPINETDFTESGYSLALSSIFEIIAPNSNERAFGRKYWKMDFGFVNEVQYNIGRICKV